MNHATTFDTENTENDESRSSFSPTFQTQAPRAGREA